jgi:periplasmic protein TonB
MKSVLKEPGEDREERRWVQRTLIGALFVGCIAGAVLIAHSFLVKPEVQKRNVQHVAILRQPPPPPPKPPEKPPEPPKVKEEVKLPEPKIEPKPDEPKPADEKPPADKPLGVDAAPGTGSDNFGLVANKGGRDITTLGAAPSINTGPSGAYYSGLLQRQFFEALSRNRKILRDEFRVVVKIWVGDDGRVQKADIVTSSGNGQVDEQIQVTLLDMAPLREVPPSSMRPIQLRLSNRS